MATLDAAPSSAVWDWGSMPSSFLVVLGKTMIGLVAPTAPPHGYPNDSNDMRLQG